MYESALGMKKEGLFFCGCTDFNKEYKKRVECLPHSTRFTFNYMRIT